jgi:3-hydroxyisobutyrate dehydrogenase-like beta-hydroxyacid dehydrogenase
MENSYKFGDMIWAKMKGFPAWPGKIEEPKSDMKPPADKRKKHFIFFFGSNNYAWIADDQIWPYTPETKAKFTSLQRAPQGFKEAVELMEEAFGKRNGRSQAKQSSGKHETADSQLTKKKRLAGDKKDGGGDTAERKKSKRSLLNVDTTALPDIISTSSPSFVSCPNAVPLKIGFLGLGTMGSIIVSALLRAGHDVTVWNRTPSKCRDFVSQGAVKGISPADVVQSCDITFSCVADSVALKELISGDCGVLMAIKPGKAFVDMSSVEVETAVELYDSVTRRGGRFLEAPLVGTLHQEQEGSQQQQQGPIVLTAGDMSLYEDCLPCFSAFAKKTFYVGEVGSATSMKLVINMLYGTMLAGLAEMLALGEKVGLQQDQILHILSLLPIASTLNATKGDAMVNSKFNPPQLSLEHMQRVLRSAIAIAEPVEQPVVVASATNELFKKAKARGYGDHDTSAIYRATD